MERLARGRRCAGSAQPQCTRGAGHGWRGGASFLLLLGGTVTNSGTISGPTWAIEFGGGNDTLTLRTGSVLNGPVEGGGGTDTVFLQGLGSEIHCSRTSSVS